MADSQTQLLFLADQVNGENLNTWGNSTEFNGNIDIVDQAMAGTVTINTTGGSATLTEAQRRQRMIKFTGSLGSNAVITVANLEKNWIIINNCTLNGFELQFKTSSGSAAEIDEGPQIVYCDGSNLIDVI